MDHLLLIDIKKVSREGGGRATWIYSAAWTSTFLKGPRATLDNEVRHTHYATTTKKVSVSADL